MNALDSFINAVQNKRLEARIREVCEKASTVEVHEHELAIIRQELLCLTHQKTSRTRSAMIKEYIDATLVKWYRA